MLTRGSYAVLTGDGYLLGIIQFVNALWLHYEVLQFRSKSNVARLAHTNWYL